MDPWVSEEERLPVRALFRTLFEKYTAGVRQLLNVQRVKIADSDGNEGLPILSWCGDPIEILSVFHPQGEAIERSPRHPAQGAGKSRLKACDR
jgi:hypothetical protein